MRGEKADVYIRVGSGGKRKLSTLCRIVENSMR